MQVLTAKGWNEFVAYHLHERQVRIAVRQWQRVHAIDDAFVAYDRSHWRKVIDYVRNIGLTATLRKIYSRMSERDRNRKCVAIGWGRVLEVGTGCSDQFRVGASVGFVAPFHPKGVDEVCLHHQLVRVLDGVPEDNTAPEANNTAAPRSLRIGEVNSSVDWQRIAAWSEWSGREIDADFLAEVFERVLPDLVQNTAALELVQLPAAARPSEAIVRRVPGADKSTKRAAIFGMGQYAKTAIAPRMGRFVDIACWHEIDPTQVGPIAKWPYDVRTSIDPSHDERYDVYFVAGFHHTHVPIALHALNIGADVVVEKPLATTQQQLDALLVALRDSKSRFFAGFHKRYNPLNDMIRQDIAPVPGTPLSYRAIVYEIPLPKNHWYCWPSSRGRIVSNGCHWIDHFLFLNDFSPPTRIESRRLGNGDVVMMIDLENGAACSLTITEQGSARLGVREIVCVTAGDRTATIIDDREYSAESSQRLLRRTKRPRHASSHRMYDEIGQRLVDGRPGDTLASIEISTRTILRAEENLQ